MMLYNRPVILAIDCFIINLEDGGDLTDRGASGHLEHKLKSKVGGVKKLLRMG